MSTRRHPPPARRQGKSKRRGPPKTIPHAFGFRPEVDLNKLNQLVDEMEAENYAVHQDSRRSRSRE